MEALGPWVAHEDVERPFDRWSWLDDCATCLVALKREAAARPRRVLCLKTSCDRVCVTAEYLAEVLEAGHEVEELCYVRDDWVREVFVVGDDALWPPARWWSLTLAEEERASGRRVRLRRLRVRSSDGRAGAPPGLRPFTPAVKERTR
jgi:hypothetical protein